MMKHLPLSWLVASTLTMAAPVFAANEDLDELQTRLGADWQILKNDQLHGLKTYAKQEKGKRYRSFKVDATMNGTMENAVKLLLDFDNYKKWSWEVMESRLLKQVSPTEYYFYVTHRAPLGVPNRDIIVHMVIEPQTRNKPGLVVRMNSATQYLPERPPYVRMLAEDMVNTFTPVSKDKISVQSEGYIDPGGDMAPWAINFTQRNAPYATLLGIRRMLMVSEDVNPKIKVPFPVYGPEILP